MTSRRYLLKLARSVIDLGAVLASDGRRTPERASSAAPSAPANCEARRVRCWTETSPEETLCQRDGRMRMPHLRRWWLRRPPAVEQSSAAVYLHEHTAADAWPPHTHPWASVSLVVAGVLVDQQYGDDGTMQQQWRLHAGDVFYRPAAHCHLLRPARKPALTLVETGPRVQPWGFLRPDGTGRPRPRRTRADRAPGAPAARSDPLTVMTWDHASSTARTTAAARAAAVALVQARVTGGVGLGDALGIVSADAGVSVPTLRRWVARAAAAERGRAGGDGGAGRPPAGRPAGDGLDAAGRRGRVAALAGRLYAPGVALGGRLPGDGASGGGHPWMEAAGREGVPAAPSCGDAGAADRAGARGAPGGPGDVSVSTAQRRGAGAPGDSSTATATGTTCS